MHNGYLQVEGEKMSKSLGSFITVHDLLKEHHGETIRLAMLMTHYRQPINWTADGLAQAKSQLDGWYGALRGGKGEAADAPSALVEALSDDLNTPLAISALHEAAGAVNKSGTAEDAGTLQSGADLLGLLQLDPDDWFKWQPAGAASLADADVDALIEERNAARAGKNFDRADEIRDQLAEAGILLEDGAQGTAWKRA